MSNTQKNKHLVKDKAELIHQEPKPQPNPKHPKQHHWRICGNKEYLVKSCTRHNRDGSTSYIPCKCVTNPNQKNHQDELRFNEIIAMTELHFKDLHDPELRSGVKDFLDKFSAGDKFDHEIIGWAKYWSDILKPTEPLNLNLIKALIASESTFDEKSVYNDNPLNKKKLKSNPRGLMQIRADTRKFLAMTKELAEHLVVLTTAEELLNGSANICAGIRWLFRKRDLIDTSKLTRPVKWIDAVAHYKAQPICDKLSDYKFYDEKKSKKKSPMRLFWEKYHMLTGSDPW